MSQNEAVFPPDEEMYAALSHAMGWYLVDNRYGKGERWWCDDFGDPNDPDPGMEAIIRRDDEYDGLGRPDQQEADSGHDAFFRLVDRIVRKKNCPLVISHEDGQRVVRIGSTIHKDAKKPIERLVTEAAWLEFCAGK